MLTDFYKQFKSGTDIRGVASEGVQGQEVNLTNEAVANMTWGFACFLQDKLGKKAEEMKIIFTQAFQMKAARVFARYRVSLLQF